MKSTVASFETLEGRKLFAASPHIISVLPDNRGQVLIKFDAALTASTVNASSVALYTAGTDGRLGTADDQKVNATVSYADATRTVTVTSAITANTTYRIRVSDTVKGANGARLDGEYTRPSQPSGDGVPGGIYDVSTTPKAQQIVRFTTRAGSFEVLLRGDEAPQTVANFLSYANSGVWDRTFFHRSVALNNSLTDQADFVVQGGGFYVDSANKVDEIATKAPVVNEPGISNTIGTIAMAKTADNPNSATNQWFFNLKDNSQALDNQNGGFTVFGNVLNPADLTVVQNISKYQRVDAGSPFEDLPVVNRQTVINRGNIDPNADLIKVTRVALEVGVKALTPFQIQTTGDFNNDGQDDIVYRDVTTGANVIWFMQNGTRIGTQSLPGILNLDWKAVGAGDFNDDGKMDILWRNQASGANTVSLLNGGAIIQFKAIPPIASQNWQVGAVADFNKDGQPDVLWRNYATGQNSFWLMNNAYGVAQYKAFQGIANLDQMIGGAFKIENNNYAVIVRNTLTGQNTAFRLNGTNVAGTVAMTANTNTSMQLLGAGYFNGDDNGDLLFGNPSTKVYQMWFYNGPARIGTANI